MNLTSRFSLVLLLASLAWSQSVTQGPLLLPAADIRVYQAKAGLVASDFVFILDPVAGGQEFLDLRYDDATLVFSLVRPDGVEMGLAGAGHELVPIIRDN